MSLSSSFSPSPSLSTSGSSESAGSAHERPWADPQAKPHVSIRSVVKRFGDMCAIDALSLDIYRGEFFSLLGPSGCGKTTLLRMLAGFETPSSGQIFLDGEDVSSVPPHQRPVNMMFQSYALFPHMTVEQNIAFGLKQDRLPKAEIKARVEQMVEMVKLQAFIKRKPHQLSGGQRQRVALVRSLVKNPKLLLLDEPLGALDKKLRQETQFELMNIQEQLGISFVIVTHDQEEAMTVSSRIAVMDAGRIVQVGTPNEIYEYPSSRYVAEFIGEVNVFEGHVSQVDQHGTVLVSDDGQRVSRSQRASALAVGQRGCMAVRPEKMMISPEPPQSIDAQQAENCLQGRVEDIGYLGHFSVYHVRLSDQSKVTVMQANRTRERASAVTWDDPVSVHWHPADAVMLSH